MNETTKYGLFFLGGVMLGALGRSLSRAVSSM